MTPRRALTLVAVVNALFLITLIMWAAAGWPGPPNHLLKGNAFYCEAIRPGPIKQPANTLSNFGFIVVGLWLATRARSRRAAAFALIVSLLGPGSMALHASMTSPGGAIDVSSMYLFIGFALLHDAARLIDVVDRRFTGAFAAMCGAMIVLGVVGHEWGPQTFAALIAAFLIAELTVYLKGRGPTRDRRRLGFATIFFGAGYACWLLSEKSTGPWCSPYSWVQGHAAWHLLCALAAGTIYLYLEPELT